MGRISETPFWVEQLYRIQVSDPILGGEDGLTNIQPSQLANRTRYLREILTREHDESGAHCIVGNMLVDDAGLEEKKLSLEVGTLDIQRQIKDCDNEIEKLSGEVSDILGPDGQQLRGLVQSVLLLWKYSGYGFGYESFSGQLVLRAMPDRQVSGAVSGDDSINCDDNSAVASGCRVLLYNSEQVVEVEPITCLEYGRVLLKRPLEQSFPSGTLSLTNWKVEDGFAVGAPGQVYLSSILEILADAPSGTLILTRDLHRGELKLSYRNIRGTGEWVELTKESESASLVDSRYIDEYYAVPGGYIQLRAEVVGSLSVTVHRIILFPQPVRQLLAVVKAPVLVGINSGETVMHDNIKLESSPYRNCYGDPMKHAEYRLVGGEDADFIFTFPDTEAHILDEKEAPPEGSYVFMCRHVSDVGDSSEWDQVKDVYVKKHVKYFGFQGHPDAGGFGTSPFRMQNDETVHFGFEGTASSGGFDTAPFVVPATE